MKPISIECCQPLAPEMDRTRVGGKAHFLAKVQAAGFSVPETAVIPCDVLMTFLDNAGLGDTIQDYLTAFENDNAETLANRFNTISENFRDAKMPRAFENQIVAEGEKLLGGAIGGLAIRSSAVVEDTDDFSCAGIFDSVIGVSNPADVVAAVKRVWCSLWAPKAVRYLHRNGIDLCGNPMSGMAVIMQRIGEVHTSGVIHTADSRTGDPWRFVVHSTGGLSVNLMGQDGTGDRFVLDWEIGAFLENEICRKPKRLEAKNGTVVELPADKDKIDSPSLDAENGKSLAAAALSLDANFGKRLDIEWAFNSDGLVILQARPLTGLPEFFPHQLSGEQAKKQWWAAGQFGAVRRGAYAGKPKEPAEYQPAYLIEIDGQECWKRYQPRDYYYYADPGKMTLDVNGYRFATNTGWTTLFDHVDGNAGMEEWFLKHEPVCRKQWLTFEPQNQSLAKIAANGIRTTSTSAELIPVLLKVRDWSTDLGALVWGPAQSFHIFATEMLKGFCKDHLPPEIDPETLLSAGADSQTFRHTLKLQELAHGISEQPVRHAIGHLDVAEFHQWIVRETRANRFSGTFESYCMESGLTPPSWQKRDFPWSDESGFANTLQALTSIKQCVKGVAREAESVRQAAYDRLASEVAQVYDALKKTDSAQIERFDRIHEWAMFWNVAINSRTGSHMIWHYELIHEVGERLRKEGRIARASDLFLFYPSDLMEFVNGMSPDNFETLYKKRKRTDSMNKRLTPPVLLGWNAVARKEEWRTLRRNPAPQAMVVTSQTTFEFLGKGNNRGQTTGRARKTDGKNDFAFFDSLKKDDIAVIANDSSSHHSDWHSALMVVSGVVSFGKPYHHLVQIANECGVPLIGWIDGDSNAIAEGSQISMDSGTGLVRIVKA